MHIRKRLDAARDWLMTPACVLCAAPASGGRHFCRACEDALPALGASCAVCATPLATDAAGSICGRCQRHPPRYDCVQAPFRYAPPIDRLIQGAKYGSRFDWLDILGGRLAEHVRGRAHRVDVIVPVPLHRSRLRARGYNQSLELARPLAKRLALPLQRALARSRATPPQAAMSRADRRRNVRDAFDATIELAGLRVAVIDDVMTSGETIEAATRCLHAAGALSVEAWVVARA